MSIQDVVASSIPAGTDTGTAELLKLHFSILEEILSELKRITFELETATETESEVRGE